MGTMPSFSDLATLRSAQRAGFRSGVAGVLSGGSYRTAPVRVHRNVGSPRTDRAARYGDVARVKGDVGRADRGNT